MSSNSTTLQTLFRIFITGSHILHHQSVLDAYGHLSFRHPTNVSTFFMSRQIAPGIISSPSDIVEYHVDNGEPVASSAPQGYAERYIHSEIYKRHAEVNAAVHSHSETVLPYTVSGVPLRPVYHMAGFLEAEGAPVYEISRYRTDGDKRDMLVSNEHLGQGLAEMFDGGVGVVLMRGHGFTAVGGRMEEVVLRAVYTSKNAAVQTAALTGRAAYLGLGGGMGGGDGDGIRYLSEEETRDATEMTRWSMMKPWEMWVREVEADGLYVNDA